MSTFFEVVASEKTEVLNPETGHVDEHALTPKYSDALAQARALESIIQQQQAAIAQMKERHDQIFHVNQAYEKGHEFLRKKLATSEEERKKYRAALVRLKKLPKLEPTEEEKREAAFAASAELARQNAVTALAEDRTLLLERLRAAENLLSDARQFAPDPAAIDEFLNDRPRTK